MSTTSSTETQKGIKGQIKITKHCIKYLCKQNNPTDILNNQTSYEMLYYLQQILGNDTFLKSNPKWKFFETKYFNFDNLIVNLWFHFSDIFDQIKFPLNQLNPTDKSSETSLNERRVNGLDFLITITQSITANQFLNDTLTNFNINLFNLDILKPILSILNSESLQISLADKSNTYVYDLLVGILAILLDISENSNNDILVWKNLKAEPTLNKIKGWVKSYSFIIDEISININKKSLRESLEYINSLSIDDKFTQNEQVYIDLLFIYKLVHVKSLKDHKIFIDFKCREKFLSILQYFFSIKTQFTYSFKIKYDYPNKQASQDEKKLSIFNYINLIINNIVFQSIEMAIYFNKKEMIKLFVDFLNDNDFMSKVMVSNPAIVSNIINNLTLLSKFSDMNQKEWLDLNTIESITNLINSRYMNIVWYKTVNEKIITSGLKCLSNLLHAYEITRIPLFDNYVKTIINYINNFIEMIENDNLKFKITRKEIEYLTDDNELIMIKTFWHENSAVLSKLNELRRFASCLKYQKMIFTECEHSIKTIIYNGNNIEKLISLKLMSQLCINKPNSNKLVTDEQFINFLHIVYDKQSNLELKRMIDNILWLLGKFEYEKETKTNSSIMISYSYSKRQSVIKLKDDLNKLGYKVWLNINELNGSNLNETLKSIENSACVLICICEKYLFNESCCIEAKYAFQLNKPIMGLIIQDGSDKLKCWLDEILNKESMFLNLSNWNESLIKLDAFLTSELKINKICSNNRSVNMQINNEIEKWSQDQVQNWFTQSGINAKLIRTYANFDGYLLKQLYAIRNETPEFFFQSMVNECKSIGNDEIKLADIAFFMDKLEKLFSQT